MKLVVGLGNPGRQYVGTRHNVGYDVVDALAVRFGWTAGRDEFDRVALSKFDGLMMSGNVTVGGVDSKILLLKPTTYMNLSGKSVLSAMTFYRVDPSDVMIVVDDMALACGRIRLRAGGSSGGHNGLRDIERVLGTNQYPRLRIGIGVPPGRVPWVDYVLTRFTDEQKPLMALAVNEAVSAVDRWLEAGIARAMNEVNAAEDDKKS